MKHSHSRIGHGWVVLCIMLGLALPIGASRAEAPPNPETEGLPPRSLIQATPARPIPGWVESNLRIGHLPPAQARQINEYLRLGYNVVSVNTLTHWDAVGPSAGLYTAAKVKESDAYLRRIVETIHKAGAKAVFYAGPVQVPAFSKEIREAHPDWLLVHDNGTVSNDFGNIRSGYGDWLLKQLAYVAREYKVDGFWFDGFAPVHLHTYDEATKKAFREFSGGKEIPPKGKLGELKDPVIRQYFQWHEQYFVNFADRMREAVRKENPECVLYGNYSANRTWYMPEYYIGEYPAVYANAIDLPSVELYWDNPGDALYQQFCYAFVQGVSHGRGARVWVQPMPYGISGVAPRVEMLLRNLEGAPWGVYTEFVEPTGREPYADDYVKQVMARDKFWSFSEPVPYIGVVASEQSRALEHALPDYFSHTLGAFRAVFEKHLPVRVLTEYDLEDAKLQGVRVLVLPNVLVMSDRAAEVVRRWVAGGGGLIASYETSLYNEKFQKRTDYALADVFKVHYEAAHPVSMREENIGVWLAGEHPIINDPLITDQQETSWQNPDGPPPSKGGMDLVASAVKVRTADGATTVAVWRPAQGPGEFPAILASQYGKGRVVFLAASIDKGMFYYPNTWMRQMMVNACAWAARDAAAPLEVKGPLMLATTFRRQPKENRTIVHLLNDHSSYGRHSIYQKQAPTPKELTQQVGRPDRPELRGTWPVREEIIPLHDIKVICRQKGVKKATLQPEGLDLPLTERPDGVEVVVPKLTMYSMVVFE